MASGQTAMQTGAYRAWGFRDLEGAFDGEQVRPTYQMALIEQAGHFLILKTYKESQQMPGRHRQNWVALGKLPGVTVICVWGTDGHRKAYQIFGREGEQQPVVADSDGFRRVVTAWFRYVRKQPKDDLHDSMWQASQKGYR